MTLGLLLSLALRVVSTIPVINPDWVNSIPSDTLTGMILAPLATPLWVPAAMPATDV
jgi:hypothetical protein